MNRGLIVAALVGTALLLWSRQAEAAPEEPEPEPEPGPPLPFFFSDISAKRVNMASAPAWDTIVFQCLVTNPNDIAATERLAVKAEYTYADGTKRTLGVWSFDLTLTRGEIYSFNWNGNTYGQRKPEAYNGPSIGVGCRLCMWLQDQFGNSSARGCV